jgi:hypothetical protein
MIRFYIYPFFSDNCFVVLPVGRSLWWEDGSVTYSAIAAWSGHWGPISIHYRLIWDCVPSSSPLTTRKDCGGGILTRLHTGFSPLGTSATIWPILLRQARTDGQRWVWSNRKLRIGKENGSIRRKPAPVPLCPPQIPHACWARTRAAAWTTVRPRNYSRTTIVTVCNYDWYNM